jgi:hypothetical protein
MPTCMHACRLLAYISAVSLLPSAAIRKHSLYVCVSCLYLHARAYVYINECRFVALRRDVVLPPAAIIDTTPEPVETPRPTNYDAAIVGM